MTSTVCFGRFSISSASRPFLRAPGKLATPAFPASARLRAPRAPRPAPRAPQSAHGFSPHLAPPCPAPEKGPSLREEGARLRASQSQSGGGWPATGGGALGGGVMEGGSG